MSEELEHLANGDTFEGYDSNSTEQSIKTIFIQMKVPCDETSDEVSDNEDAQALEETAGVVKTVQITSDINCKSFKKLLHSTFQLEEENITLKLRNQRGSIIPLSFAIQENSDSRPYILEVCKIFENVTPLQRTASLPTYEEVLKRKLQSLDNRVIKLSQHVPCLPERQEEKVQTAINNLNDRMNLLERKLADADDTHWQGMFKRNPLW